MLSLSTWSKAALDEMRQVGDPPADQVIAALAARGQVDSVNQLMRELIRNDRLPPEAMPPMVSDYFDATDDLPPWADPEKISKEQEFFNRFGPQTAMVLNTYALPTCYAAAKGVQVLYRTAQLYINPRRRTPII